MIGSFELHIAALYGGRPVCVGSAPFPGGQTMRSRPRVTINQQQTPQRGAGGETRHYKTLGFQVRRRFPPLMAPVQP